MTSETIVVLSDIHANGRSLRRAVELARQAPVTRWIILGDLLTYGVDGDEVLDIVEALCTDENALLLRGNHDQMYLDLAAGDDSYYRGLPEWIRESVDTTARSVDLTRLSHLPWQDDAVIGDMLFSHANPFGDWTYLKDEESLARAALTVVERGHRVGVFGHVHRHRAWVGDGDSGVLHSGQSVTISRPQFAALTAGSVGQPREAGKAPSYLGVESNGDILTTTSVPIDFDVDAHIDAINSSPLSEATRERLIGFFARG